LRWIVRAVAFRHGDDVDLGHGAGPTVRRRQRS
jgi:hypothetical protein